MTTIQRAGSAHCHEEDRSRVCAYLIIALRLVRLSRDLIGDVQSGDTCASEGSLGLLSIKWYTSRFLSTTPPTSFTECERDYSSRVDLRRIHRPLAPQLCFGGVIYRHGSLGRQSPLPLPAQVHYFRREYRWRRQFQFQYTYVTHCTSRLIHNHSSPRYRIKWRAVGELRPLSSLHESIPIMSSCWGTAEWCLMWRLWHSLQSKAVGWPSFPYSESARTDISDDSSNADLDTSQTTSSLAWRRAESNSIKPNIYSSWIWSETSAMLLIDPRSTLLPQFSVTRNWRSPIWDSVGEQWDWVTMRSLMGWRRLWRSGIMWVRKLGASRQRSRNLCDTPASIFKNMGRTLSPWTNLILSSWI